MMLVISSIGYAAPIVSGNTLTWSDDGWYQVQRADTYETVCEGMDSASSSVSGGACVIDASSYIVINHTTGERFEGIAAGSASSTVSSVVSEGGRISWPDDGWYQVQNADTYETVCEGGQGCNVVAGNYVVINHTSGERFIDVRVDSESPGGGGNAAGVSVAGQMLSWPDDGWYQVQEADSFSTVCEGGVGCTVEPGNYIVINHTTGERFTDITVEAGSAGGGDTVPDTDTATGSDNRPASVVVVGATIRWPDDGWYQVQSDGGVTVYCQGGSECRVAPGRYEVLNLTNGELTQVSVALGSTRVSFAITVPAYVSDSLQVRVVWGNRDISATWNRNEFWTVSDYFPRETENRLSITFTDRNGDVTLGSFEQDFRTSAGSSQTFQISADQFDTARWDTNGDGVSNLDEAIAGSELVAVPVVDEENGLELRDSPSIFDIWLIRRVSSYYEESISQERPYYLATEDIRPLIIDSINRGLYSDVVAIDIDQVGTGSFADNFSNSYPGDADTESQNATRTNTGSAIIWAGSYRWSNRSSGLYFDLGFTTEFQVLDTQTRTLQGMIEREGSRDASQGYRQQNIAYSLTGIVSDDSSFCTPIAGNILNDVAGSVTTIAKAVDDQYWKVRVANRRGEMTEEYLAESLPLGFYCAYGDLP